MQDDSSSTRWCSRCWAYKPLNEFYKGSSSYCKPCAKEYRQEYRNRHTSRKLNLKHTYGLTIEQHDKMVWDQDGRCAICGEVPEPVKGRRLHVDHDHETGKVRELLCRGCNHGIGNFMEDPERLRKAIEYLVKWKT